MLDYFESGQAAHDNVRGLLLWSYSRFAREEVDTQFFINLIRRAGFTVHSLTDQVPEGDFARLFESIAFWQAAQYSRTLSKDVRRGQSYVLNNYRDDGGLYQLPTGEHVQLSGGGFPPLGYERVQVQTGHTRRSIQRFNSYWRKTTDPDLARRIRLAWEMFLSGQSYTQIEKACQLQIESQNYNDLFTTITYTGTYSYGPFTRQNAFEPYVTTREYEQAQQIMEDRRQGTGKRPSLYRYLLSGLLYCGKCGRPYHGLRCSRAQRTDIYYYECASRPQRQRCSPDTRRVRAADLESIVLTKIISTLNPETITTLAQRIEGQRLIQREKDRKPITILQETIDRETATIRNLLTQLATTAARLNITADFEALITQAEQRRSRAAAELEKLKIKHQGIEEGELYIRVEKIDTARQMLEAFLATGQPSGALYPHETVENAHKLLDALCVKAIIYPSETGQETIAVTLDLGILTETTTHPTTPNPPIQTPRTQKTTSPDSTSDVVSQFVRARRDSNPRLSVPKTDALVH